MTKMATSTTNHPQVAVQDAAASPSTHHTEHRQVVYRVLPGSAGRARRLASIAGACRFVWNELLDQQEQLHIMARMCAGRTPSPTFFTLSKAFTDLRRVTPWLQDMPYAAVRYTLKYQADAWRRFFDGTAGRPRFKRRGRDSVTIPQDVRIEDNQLWLPRLGWLALRRRGGNPYPEGRPVKAVLKRVGHRWMATVCYEVEVPARADDDTVTGIDRNVRQVASFDGEQARLHHGPDTARLEARTRRYQRRRLARTTRRIANVRHSWHHQVSHQLAAGTVVLENLSTRSMTKSAKGTAAEPGVNVRAKSGLNRVILATGWGSFEQMLAYKAPCLVKVPAKDTSRTCHACGHVDAASRRSQTTFRCVPCGHADHADANAARNIRRRGLALLHGEERSAKPTPLTRETDRRLAA